MTTGEKKPSAEAMRAAKTIDTALSLQADNGLITIPDMAEIIDVEYRELRRCTVLDVDAILRVATGKLDRGTPEERLLYIAETCRIILERLGSE